MKIIFVGILVALLCATAKSEKNLQATLRLVSMPEFNKHLNKYLSNIKCISGVVDQVLVDGDSKVWWQDIKARIIQQVNVDLKKCMEVTDPEEQMKCKYALIENGIATGFEVPTYFVGSISWEVTKTIRQKLLWKCMDPKALLQLLNQMKQWGVLTVLPEVMTEYATMFGEASKRNGNEVEWAKTETKLQPHLAKWNQCSQKSFRLTAAYCHLKEGTTSARLMAEHILAIGEQNKPMMVQLIEECRQKWFLPPKEE